MLVIDDYVFKLNKTTTTTKYYRCEHRECDVTVHTDINDVPLKTKGDHCHVIEPEKNIIRIFKQVVKERVINESTPIPKIYEEESAKMILTPATIAILPSQREMSSSLNKARRLETPRIPDSQIFDIPDIYTKTLKNKEFLCVDKMIKRKTRILLFASNEQLKLLFENSIVFMDGTFSACPKVFDQVFTIHSIKYEQSFMCVIGLLPDRKKSTYKFVFEELKALAIGMNQIFDPSTIISDFEQGLGEAISREFPNSNHIGCYFHFTQAVYRHIQQLGLSSAYINDDNIRMICRKLMALALLPSSVVLKSFEDLYEIVLLASSSELRLLGPLFDYFENYWIKKIDINKWNVYGIRIRTNSNAEGFHNRLNLRIAKYHPNIWTFIRCIQGEENRFNHVLIQMIGGLAARSKTAATNAIQQRIDTLYLRYQNDDIIVDELLNGLSYVVAKNITSKRKK
ncbi:unnamed protein product [Rotaria sp. Silwood2]|nr:unnamed protein product [Rotaria sp. Silwood2]CAF3015787.1 unnamed protein product [Rotaria sp. Silwood2]CAF3307010.1 unnamed protein product [Rotaria sp. Silwood2]CAF3422619.1 unnamed protein product [Rotaria sp. Silwood2]CAF4247839.1 unnamed protein product [Rotaria sp. Silwood2]